MKPILIFDYDETLVTGFNSLYDDKLQLLNGLQKEQFTLWLVSFNDQLMQNARIHDILHYFKRVKNGYDHRRKSYMIQYLCHQNQVRPVDCIFFDDLPDNIDDANDLGVQSCLVNHETGVTEDDIFNELSFYILQRLSQCEERQQHLPIVVVASLNPAKKHAVERIFPCYQVEAISSISGVSSQPCGVEETRTGAINRLNFIMERYPDVEYWVAIENGLIPDYDMPNRWSDVAFVAMRRNDDLKQTIITRSAAVRTSYTGVEDLERYQEEISQVNNRACEYFTQGQCTRLELMTQAVKLARFNTV